MKTLKEFIINESNDINTVYDEFEKIIWPSKNKTSLDLFNQFCEQLIKFSQDPKYNSKSKWICSIFKNSDSYILSVDNDIQKNHYRIYWPGTIDGIENDRMQRLRRLISTERQGLDNKVTILYAEEKYFDSKPIAELNISPKIIKEMLKPYCYKYWFYYGGHAHGPGNTSR